MPFVSGPAISCAIIYFSFTLVDATLSCSDSWPKGGLIDTKSCDGSRAYFQLRFAFTECAAAATRVCDWLAWACEPLIPEIANAK